MKNFGPALLLIASVILVAGCQSTGNRINKDEIFARVDKATQEKIEQGIVDLGFTEDMVYLALGTPNQKSESVTPAGRTVTWVYSTVSDRPDEIGALGNQGLYYDPLDQRYAETRTYDVHGHDPFAYVDTETSGAYEHALFLRTRGQYQERIRVTFENGRVSAIQLAKS